MVMLTDKAVQKFKEFLEQERDVDYGIRIFASSGG